MMHGIMYKLVLETWPATAAFGGALAVFGALLGYVIPTFFGDMAPMLEIAFIRNIVRGVLGADVGASMGRDVLGAFPWAHPVVLALLWSHEITVCTRFPVGEIDRGTIDVIMSLPVSRARLFVNSSVVWLASGTVVLALGVAGNLVGQQFVPVESRPLGTPWVAIIGNLAALYFAVGSVTLFVSAISDRRGAAVGLALGWILTSFFLNFLSHLWLSAKRIAFLSVLNYYRPLGVIRDASDAVRDAGILLAIGAAAWTAGLIAFVRRDIRIT